MADPGYTCVLVDLDGTVVDSAPGITGAVAAVLVDLGRPVPSPAALLRFVGPPILDGLRDVVGVEGEAAQAVLAAYRDRYRAGGAFEAVPYPGVREALAAIGAVLPLGIATSKPESIATAILQHLGLADLFTAIAGASEDESRSRKAEVVERCLHLLAARGVDTARPVLVGDRSHDVEGAAEHGVPCVLAGWGYGAPEEAAGAIAVAAVPADLPALVLPPPAPRAS